MSWRNSYILMAAIFVSAACYLTHRQTRYALVVGNALNLIHEFYVEPVDDRELLVAALDGMTQGLDPYSSFVPLEDYQRLQDAMKQEFAGIGIYVDQPSETEPVRVITPLVGSPALDAGLKANDRIVKVDGESVVGWTLADVSGRLKGPVGSRVELVVLRNEQEVTLTVQRGNIELESVVGDWRDSDNRWQFRLADHPEIGYARLTTFGDKTAGELRDVLKQAEGVRAFILDLRTNGGGLLDAAVDVCDLFLDSGRIVSTAVRGGQTETTHDASQGTTLDPSIPVVVMINHDSASASEIVAAALQDHGRATIVGTRSFGKGTVQNVLPLEVGRSALKLTVAKYIRPSGANIHRSAEATEDDVWGVSPAADAVVEMDDAQIGGLVQRWQEAAYPHASLEDSAPADSHSNPTDSPPVDEAPSPEGSPATERPKIELPVSELPETEEFVDPQLKRAVQILMGEDEPSMEPSAAVDVAA